MILNQKYLFSYTESYLKSILSLTINTLNYSLNYLKFRLLNKTFDSPTMYPPTTPGHVMMTRGVKNRLHHTSSPNQGPNPTNDHNSIPFSFSGHFHSRLVMFGLFLPFCQTNET